MRMKKVSTLCNQSQKAQNCIILHLIFEVEDNFFAFSFSC